MAGLAVGAGALSTVAAAKVGASPTTATLTVLVVTLAVLGVRVAGLFRVRWSLDAPSRELRRRACAEVRTARALEPLESAG